MRKISIYLPQLQDVPEIFSKVADRGAFHSQFYITLFFLYLQRIEHVTSRVSGASSR